MLIFTLLFLATASTLYYLLHGRGAVWQAWVILAIVAITSWMCSIGAYGLAVDNKSIPTDDISWMSKILIAGFLLYPLVLWMAVNSFARGRKS